MSELIDAFNKAKSKMAEQLIEGMVFPDLVVSRITCPCCGSDRVVLVDIGFEVATGRGVKTGDTHQHERCLTYFTPGEGCDEPGSENFTP